MTEAAAVVIGLVVLVFGWAMCRAAALRDQNDEIYRKKWGEE